MTPRIDSQKEAVRVQAIDASVLITFKSLIRRMCISPENAIRLGKAIASAGREARAQRSRTGLSGGARR